MPDEAAEIEAPQAKGKKAGRKGAAGELHALMHCVVA